MLARSMSEAGYLRLPQVLEIIPVSKSTWWAGCRSGRFPRPVKLGPRITIWQAAVIGRYTEAIAKGYSPEEATRIAMAGGVE